MTKLKIDWAGRELCRGCCRGGTFCSSWVGDAVSLEYDLVAKACR